jgi:Ca2+-binding RTX toxin-like protein
MAILNGDNWDNSLTGTTQADEINGLGGADTLLGQGGDDRVRGGDGDDIVRGGDGNDSLEGEAGDDFLAGGNGDDILNGGEGLDRASFSTGAYAGVTVNLTLIAAQNSGQGMDTLIGIEHVSGTRYDDVLTGNDLANWLWGGTDFSGVTGNDTISSGGGDDLVQVGTGNHLLDGGSGIDTISFHGNGTDITAAGVTVSLALQGMAQVTEQGSMTLRNFENVSGSDLADIISGDAGNNVLAGLSGADLLLGGEGDDLLLGDGLIAPLTSNSGTIGIREDVVDVYDNGWGDSDALFGGQGNDRLVGGFGDDLLQGDAGDDRLEGGGGIDTASFLLPAAAGGTLRIVEGTGNDAGLTLVQRVVDGQIETLFEISATVGALTVRGVNGAARQGTDTFSGIEKLRFASDGDVASQGGAIELDVASTMRLRADMPMSETAPHDYGSPRLAALPGGGFAMIWGTHNRHHVGYGYVDTGEVRGQLFSPSGAANGDPFVIATGPAVKNESLAIAAGASGFVAVWTQFNPDNTLDLAFRSYDLSGVPLGKARSISTSLAGVQDGGAITALEQGGYVISWHEAANADTVPSLRVQLLNADGTRRGEEIVAVESAGGMRFDATVTALTGGGFILVWSHGDKPESTIKAQFFDAAAQKSGSEWTIGDRPGHQFDPVVAVLESGDFVVAWEHQLLENDVLMAVGIVAQRYSAAGEKKGDEMQIVVSPGGEFVSDVVISEIAGGGFLIGWSRWTGQAELLETQRYDAQGNPVGGAAQLASSHYTGVDDVDLLATSGGVAVAWEAGLNLRLQLFDDRLPQLVVGDEANNRIEGSAAGETIRGLGGNDQLIGAAGADTLVGGLGVDTMTGGAGDDVYVVDQAGDIVDERGADLNDMVHSAISYTLGESLEHLTLGGTGAIHGTGNGAGNGLTGNGAANRLTGLGGNDMLDGGIGADTMIGGLGNDIYVVDNASDVVTELAGEGVDEVRTALARYTLGDTLEKLTFTGSADAKGVGNALANGIAGGSGNDLLLGLDGNDSLSGGAGNDRLEGGVGADAMAGGAGDDVYLLDDAGDTVSEVGGGGSDLVQTLVRHTLGAGVENLTLLGIEALKGAGNELANLITGNDGANGISGFGGDDRIFGGKGADSLIGGDGADILDGGLGDDTMTGGLGNDIYHVDSALDVVSETGGDGIDLVLSLKSHNLRAGVENLTLTDVGSVKGGGNELANVITGNVGNNKLAGQAGNDTLIGNGGDDTIIGGVGADLLTGGTGADQFVFANGDLAASAPGSDRITDFTRAHGDRIDLSQIDAKTATTGNDAFTWIGSGAFTGAAGQLQATSAAGGWQVAGDTNGDGVADFILMVTTTDPLAAGDFLL